MADWPGPTPNNTYGDDSGGEAGVATFVRYDGPSSGFGVYWYSLDVGSVHFTLYSSEHDYSPGSAQAQWLRADLLGVNRSLTPWLVVGMHRPMYNVRADGDFTIDQGMVKNLEALFLEAKVDLALSGHVSWGRAEYALAARNTAAHLLSAPSYLSPPARAPAHPHPPARSTTSTSALTASATTRSMRPETRPST